MQSLNAQNHSGKKTKGSRPFLVAPFQVKSHCTATLRQWFNLPNDDLWSILPGGPGNAELVALRDNLAAVDMARDGGAWEVAVGGGAGAGAGFPGGAAAGDNVDGAERLVAEVA